MKNFVVGLTAIAGIAASANAAWGFKYQFSTDNGATWSSNAAVDVSSGNKAVKFRVVAYADPETPVPASGGTGPAVAYARYTGSERMSNWGSGANGDALGAQTRGALTSGGTTYLSSSFSAGNTILGGTTATSFASQLLLSGTLAAYCPSSGGTPQLEWVIRTGDMTVGQAGGTRTIVFSNNQRTQNTWYRDLLVNGVQDVNTAAPEGSPTDIAGTLQVVPAPGSLALIGLGGLVAARRRRA
ncbi:MAG: PEP-CTERM sorting domain-containing protein [Phycisphaeraceae bacterium]|nr:PEP-CTERM sorting domain-containing protein [Phycisphaeraceae bacterium]